MSFADFLLPFTTIPVSFLRNRTVAVASINCFYYFYKIHRKVSVVSWPYIISKRRNLPIFIIELFYIFYRATVEHLSSVLDPDTQTAILCKCGPRIEHVFFIFLDMISCFFYIYRYDQLFFYISLYDLLYFSIWSAVFFIISRYDQLVFLYF